MARVRKLTSKGCQEFDRREARAIVGRGLNTRPHPIPEWILSIEQALLEPQHEGDYWEYVDVEPAPAPWSIRSYIPMGYGWRSAEIFDAGGKRILLSVEPADGQEASIAAAAAAPELLAASRRAYDTLVYLSRLYQSGQGDVLDEAGYKETMVELEQAMAKAQDMSAFDPAQRR